MTVQIQSRAETDSPGRVVPEFVSKIQLFESEFEAMQALMNKEHAVEEQLCNTWKEIQRQANVSITISNPALLRELHTTGDVSLNPDGMVVVQGDDTETSIRLEDLPLGTVILVVGFAASELLSATRVKAEEVFKELGALQELVDAVGKSGRFLSNDGGKSFSTRIGHRQQEEFLAPNESNTLAETKTGEQDKTVEGTTTSPKKNSEGRSGSRYTFKGKYGSDNNDIPDDVYKSVPARVT